MAGACLSYGWLDIKWIALSTTTTTTMTTTLKISEFARMTRINILLDAMILVEVVGACLSYGWLNI